MTHLPTELSAAVERVLRERVGPNERIVATHPVGGGCVNHARVVTGSSGARYFLKHNREAPSGLFEAEAAGLDALRGTFALRVPEVLGYDVGPGRGWLLLEFIEPGPESAEYWRALGRGLASLHHALDRRPGLESDNFIGPLAQENTPTPSWSDFWTRRRLEPQLELAAAEGLLDPADALWTDAIDCIRSRLRSRDQELSDRGGLSLLHGDLWSGNVYPDARGRPVLIDPAVYYGDPEVDLAMSELFGGFGPDFFSAYHEVTGTDPGARLRRRPTYQLYPLLVHANLFGGAYLSAARDAASSICREG